MTRERQDLLSNANTASARFFATNREHLASEDYFIGIERKRRVSRTKELEKKKKQHIEAKNGA